MIQDRICIFVFNCKTICIFTGLKYKTVFSSNKSSSVTDKRAKTNIAITVRLYLLCGINLGLQTKENHSAFVIENMQIRRVYHLTQKEVLRSAFVSTAKANQHSPPRWGEHKQMFSQDLSSATTGMQKVRDIYLNVHI